MVLLIPPWLHVSSQVSCKHVPHSVASPFKRSPRIVRLSVHLREANDSSRSYLNHGTYGSITNTKAILSHQFLFKIVWRVWMHTFVREDPSLAEPITATKPTSVSVGGTSVYLYHAISISVSSQLRHYSICWWRQGYLACSFINVNHQLPFIHLNLNLIKCHAISNLFLSILPDCHMLTLTKNKTSTIVL